MLSLETKRNEILEHIFAAQGEDGLWKVIPTDHKYYPDHLHYVPMYRSSLWALLMLAEIKCPSDEERIKRPLQILKEHLYDDEYGIYTLKEDHFPIPCLNGNMLYLDGYFNGGQDPRNDRLLNFFGLNQRFDDGKYVLPLNEYCQNTSCYGNHTCYWGVVKLLKGISFMSSGQRSQEVQHLRSQCIDFILKHHVCFSSHQPNRIMIQKLDQLTFPCFYKGDFLEILWILKREKVHSKSLSRALDLLRQKQLKNGSWPLEREMHNMVTSVGNVGEANVFVSERAQEVLNYYKSVSFHHDNPMQ